MSEIYMDEKIERYILDIVFATRKPKDYGIPDVAQLISYGASPRATINLALGAKAYAFIKRRGVCDTRRRARRQPRRAPAPGSGDVTKPKQRR